MISFNDQYDYKQLDALVKRIFIIEDKTLGSSKQGYIVRYRGKLTHNDSAAAYDQIAAQLQPLLITPIFRWDHDRHSIILMPKIPRPKPSKPIINLILFIFTLLSVLLTGALYGLEDLPDISDPLNLVIQFFRRGWPFAVSMIAILGAHEFGHYLMGRFHGIQVTLPYFIPLPFSPFGTMGAFINMKGIPKNRRILHDIGVAGPFAGLIVAIPVLLIGLSLSEIDALPLIPPSGVVFQLEGNSLLYLLSKFVVFGQLLPAPASYNGLSPVLYWLRYFFTGLPSPFGGTDVLLHPVAWAGWAGLMVTAMNLIPAGQLDGGHILYVLVGRKTARRLLPIVLGILALMGLVWSGWWLWAVLIYFMGRRCAEPLDQITTLDNSRKLIAALALILLLLTFTPVPLRLM